MVGYSATPELKLTEKDLSGIFVLKLILAN